tara:strand:- start:539 stop:1252 length:714 start_codon:yes stop_codon:yes gene_type:complete
MNSPLSRALKKVKKKEIAEQVPSTTQRRRNVRSSEFRTNGKFDQEKYDAAKGRKLTKSGGGRPRKKGGALATTTGSSVQKTGSSSMTTTNKNSGVTKAEPDASNQTIDVKATTVGEIEKSKVGSMSNSGKKEVDPKKNTSIVRRTKPFQKYDKVQDKEKPYDPLNKRGEYRKTPKKDQLAKKAKRARLVKGVASAAVGTVKKAGSMAKSGIRATTSNFGTSSFSKEEITFKDYLNKL